MLQIHFLVQGVPKSPRSHSAGPYRQHISQEASKYFGSPLTERNVTLIIRHFYTSRNLLDLDNLQKTIFGALEGVAYKDDSQIVRVTAERYNISVSYRLENPSQEEIEALVHGVDFVSITVSTRE
ncbi:MAG: RusA family crossover junction endodeoxyribonuclease [Dehalococcoidia bacterium]